MHLNTIGGIIPSSLSAASASAGVTLLHTNTGQFSGYIMGGTSLANNTTQYAVHQKVGSGGRVEIYDITDGSLEVTLSQASFSSGLFFGKVLDMSEAYTAVHVPGDDKVALFNNSDGSLERSFSSPVAASGYFGAGNAIGVSDLYTAIGNFNLRKMYLYNNSTGALISTISTPTFSADEVRTTDTHALFSTSSSEPVTVYDPSDGSSRYTISNPQFDPTSASDYFGRYLDVCDDYIVLSAHTEDNPGESATNVGVVYLFNTSDGSLAQTFVNPINFDTAFGIALAVSNTYTAIGSYNEEPAGGANNGSGVVRVYNNATGALHAKIDNPNPDGTTVNDNFGAQVSLSNAGITSYIVISARYEDTNASETGNVYTYSLGTASGSNPVWSTSSALTAVVEDVAITPVTLVATDADGDTITYAFVTGTLPAGLSIATNGTLSGTPTTPGFYTFTVRASDGTGGSKDRAFTITINVTPITIPASQYARYDFRASSNYTQSGGGVSGVVDLSGNNRDSTAAYGTAANRALTSSSSGFPGLDVLRLSATGTGLGLFSTLGTTYTVVLVYASTSTSTASRRALHGSNNWLMGPYGNFHAAHSNAFIGTGAGNGRPTINTPYLYVMTSDGSNSSFYIDNVHKATKTGTQAPGLLGIGTGSGGPGSTEATLVDIASVIVYDRVLNSSELSVIHTYSQGTYSTA